MAISKQPVNYKALVNEGSTYKLIVMVGHEQFGDIDVNPYGSTLTIPDEKLPPDNSARWECELGEGSSIEDKVLALNVLSRYEKEWDENQSQHKLLQVTIDLVESKNDGTNNEMKLEPTQDDSNWKKIDNKYDIVIFKVKIKFA